MQQPHGYVDPSKPHYVYKLLKSLYGLKQAPKAWFKRFTSQLLHLGFVASLADSTLFVYHAGSTVLYLLLYVDDIIIIGSAPTQIAYLISTLSATFDLKDLGPLNYFLGIQITPTKYGLTLS